MPNYTFQCKNKKCHVVYDELADFDKTGKYKDVVCPNCNSKKKIQLPTACDFVFAQPVGTSRWISDSTGHDYRFNYNKPNVIKERENASKKSHMGSSQEIYRDIDDTKIDKNFDFKSL